MTRPRVAIAHDYITQRGGAERVILAMARAFPDARVYTTLYDPEGTFPEFAEIDIQVSPLNRVALMRRHHRLALPLLAPAASRMRIDADVVIASTTGWAHGFRTDGRVLVYCNSPARWVYFPKEYLGHRSRLSPTALALSALTPALRRWDQAAARRADVYLANSRVVRDRVRMAYGIDADVLSPPHGVTTDGEQEPVPAIAHWRDYHLVVSRLLPYKNVDVAIDAFRGLPSERLVVVGTGPLRESLSAQLPGNVVMLSDLTDAQLRWLYAHAQALVAPSIEDFGLTPLEAAAFGHPTLALRGGGYLDTVVEEVTGVFFDTATPNAVQNAVTRAQRQAWNPKVLEQHAEGFGEARFAAELRSRVDALIAENLSATRTENYSDRALNNHVSD